MSIIKTCFAMIMMVTPMLASASNAAMTNGCNNVAGSVTSHQYDHNHQQHPQHHEQAKDQQLDCRHYNRDGATCAQVGFGEGQSGSPWGQQAGMFVCMDRCLRYVGQAH